MLQNPKSKTSARQCHGHVRLDTVSDGTNSASYTYLANSPLISQISFAQTGAGRMVTTKQYDFLNRLTNIVSATNGTAIATFAYANNSANQRTSVTNFDGTFWSYTYDSLGQVTSGKRYWPDGTPVDGQQFEYSFDDIGNRISTGGRASAASTYTRTSTNAYTQRTVAGVVDVLGIANPTASVTVNGNTANRRGEYFAYPLTVANSSAVYQSVTNTSSYGSGQTVTGKVFVPGSTETFTHDQDGNLTADGRWAYSWDGENRLIQMIRDTDSPAGAREKLVFDYDWMGRRIRKRFYTYSGGYNLQSDTIFLYDGWNLICEFDASSSKPGTLIRTYIWGIDLSGSMQGAGGIGGLLKVTDYVGGTTHHFVAYDGNGSVVALVDGGTGAINARYEYGPFAEPIRTVGAMAKKLAMRFSTKYADNESGMLYYGYRSYNPSTGRWLSRDRLSERGGLNLYCVLKNAMLSKIDSLGKEEYYRTKNTHDFQWEGVGNPLEVTPSVTALAPVCVGGPLYIRVAFFCNDHDDGGGNYRNYGPSFTFSDDSSQPPANSTTVSPQDLTFQPTIHWYNELVKPLPLCPKGRQRGSVTFTAARTQPPEAADDILKIHISWTYKCDCSCVETIPLQVNYSFEASPPLSIPR